MTTVKEEREIFEHALQFTSAQARGEFVAPLTPGLKADDRRVSLAAVVNPPKNANSM